MTPKLNTIRKHLILDFSVFLNVYIRTKHNKTRKEFWYFHLQKTDIFVYMFCILLLKRFISRCLLGKERKYIPC